MIALDQAKITAAIERELSDDIASGRVGGAALLVKQHGEDTH